MKIKLSVKEAKLLLNCIYGHQCLANMHPEIHINKPEAPETLSDVEVHNKIVSMCMKNKVNLYINEVLTYTTDRPDYDRIAEELWSYDGEIVSIINEDNNWYVNTL